MWKHSYARLLYRVKIRIFFFLKKPVFKFSAKIFPQSTQNSMFYCDEISRAIQILTEIFSNPAVRFQNLSQAKNFGCEGSLLFSMEELIFDCIAKNNNSELKANLTAFNGNVNFTDENGELKAVRWFSENITKINKEILKFFHFYFQEWLHFNMLLTKETKKLFSSC